VREPGYNGAGFVVAFWCKNATIWDHDSYFARKMSYYSHHAWPIKSMPTHVCCPELAPLRFVKPIALALLDRSHRSRLVLHNTTESEILEVLSRYGLEKTMLPTQMGGTVELNLEEWVANRRAVEMEEL
jgi:hypothetical protein